MDLAQDHLQWPALVLTVLNPRILPPESSFYIKCVEVRLYWKYCCKQSGSNRDKFIDHSKWERLNFYAKKNYKRRIKEYYDLNKHFLLSEMQKNSARRFPKCRCSLAMQGMSQGVNYVLLSLSPAEHEMFGKKKTKWSRLWCYYLLHTSLLT